MFAQQMNILVLYQSHVWYNISDRQYHGVFITPGWILSKNLYELSPQNSWKCPFILAVLVLHAFVTVISIIICMLEHHSETMVWIKSDVSGSGVGWSHPFFCNASQHARKNSHMFSARFPVSWWTSGWRPAFTVLSCLSVLDTSQLPHIQQPTVQPTVGHYALSSLGHLLSRKNWYNCWHSTLPGTIGGSSPHIQTPHLYLASGVYVIGRGWLLAQWPFAGNVPVGCLSRINHNPLTLALI